MIPIINVDNDETEVCYENILNEFDKSGCVLLRGLLAGKEKELLKLHQNTLPEYVTGEKHLEQPVTRNSDWFKSVGSIEHAGRTIRYDGVPNSYRLMRGQGPYDLKTMNNAFFGKRLSLNLVNVENNFFELIFTKKFKGVSASILNTSSSNLCYYEGSMNVVFPGYPGESGMLHMDTYGFTGGDMRITPERTKPVPFINAIVYLTAANEDCAGTRVIPGTNKKYSEINEIVGQAFGLRRGLNHIHQRELYDEIFLRNNHLGNIERVEAQPGDIFIFSSNTVHGIPGNFSDNKERRVVIFNLGRADETFGKVRTKAEKLILKEKLDLVSLKMSELSLKANVIRKSKKIKKVLKKKIIAKVKNIKAVASINKNLTTSKQLLNIGSGDHFYINGWTRLDYNDDAEKVGERIKRRCDVNFDLLSGKPLPFEDATFDGIYTSHTIEHLHNADVERIIEDCFRILKPGGVLRVVCPSINKYFDAYDELDLGFFNWIRNKNIYRHDSLLRLITREFAHIIVDKYSDEELMQMYAKLGREGYIDKLSLDTDASKTEFAQTLPDVHKSAWTEEKLKKLIMRFGASLNPDVSRFESKLPEFSGTQNNMINNTRPHVSLYCEGVKAET